jgi:Histidine kinase-like ATPase domain
VVSRHGCLADPDDVALVVSELFTNAVLHGPPGGLVLVGYCLWPGGARVVVCDAGGATTARLVEPGELQEGGRGLQVVDQLAAAWGSLRIGNAQAVWCDLDERLDSAALSTQWAWLRAIVAAGVLSAPATRMAAGNSTALASACSRKAFELG